MVDLLDGDLWAALTKKGLEVVRLPFAAQRPSAWRLRHTLAVARVRLDVESRRLQWRSELALAEEYARLERTGITPGNEDGTGRKTGKLFHRPDGAIPLDAYDSALGVRLRAVEVELSPKSVAAYTDDLEKLHPAIREVVYMTPGGSWSA